MNGKKYKPKFLYNWTPILKTFMKIKISPPKLAWALFGLLAVLAFREFLNINILAYVNDQDLLESRRFIVYIIVSTLTALGWLGFYFLHFVKGRSFPCCFFSNIPSKIKFIINFLVIISPAMLKWILPMPENFALGSWIMIFFFYSAALIAIQLKDLKENLPKSIVFLAGYFMFSGAAYAIIARMNLVTSYPFPTFWSEGNRFFDYSALLGAFRYILPPGETLSVFSSWGMQFPWALPFLIPNLSIGAFRLWNQLVWIIPGIILGLVIAQPGRKKATIFATLVFTLWTLLFIDQGPIYAPIIIGAILTVIAVRQKLIPGMLIIFIAAIYTRYARWTWAYGPGLWGGMLALLQIDSPSFKSDNWKKLLKPIFLGISGYIGAQFIPSLVKVITGGSQLELFPDATTSTTRQPLLWDRLWPNATYQPGIVLGIIWAAIPLAILLFYMLIKKYWKLNLLQILSKTTIAITFLIVGIIASTKIGGGSNLHNLDSFIITLVLIGGAAFLFVINKAKIDINQDLLLAILIACALISPVTYTLQNGERLSLPSPEKTNESLNAVRNKVQEYSSQGEILFIDHRQLLTFGLVKNVPLINDYEKKRLMDNAMADDTDYFEGFYDDLSAQRFALIVNEPSNIIDRGSDYSFGEENDAYVRWATVPLLCYYEPLYTSQATALELLIPRTSESPEILNCQEVFPNLHE